MICAICGHQSNKVICATCDHKLACVNDDSFWLRQAADWLEGKTLADELEKVASESR